jgi:integrase
MKLNYPKVHTDKSQKVFISFFIQNKRYRLYNGKRIDSPINPNSFPVDQRKTIANLLAAEIYDYLINGGVLKSFRNNNIISNKLTDKEYLSIALDVKLKGQYSDNYKKMLQWIFNTITTIMKGDKLTSDHVKNFIDNYSSNTSYNTIRRHLNVLINEAISQGMQENPMANIKSRKSKAILNKPFQDVGAILNELKTYNNSLYLCCLITFGCLLRPHREVRELRWGDFSDDLRHICLSGDRNKSGRNRIVPVPSYIRELLQKGDCKDSIFTGTSKLPNSDYFKTLWGRYKKTSILLEPNQTLYSFRHSGAINIFKRTGSLSKLQKAMGHSSLNVSLTYLRGLEVADLKEEDMPMI